MQARRFLGYASLPVALITAVGVATTLAPNARAGARHLELLRSQPARDTTVAATPASLKLWFSEPPETAISSIRLTGPDSAVVTLGKLTLDKATNAPLVAPVTGKMKPGRQKVAWRTMGDDGHAVTGEFVFTLAPPKTPPPTP
jgi:hypothetical protein